MSDWFGSKKSDQVTHYCGGTVHDKGGAKKVKATQTKLTKWFHPVTISDDGVMKCEACFTEVNREDIKIPLI
jgi:hypothetical protein